MRNVEICEKCTLGRDEFAVSYFNEIHQLSSLGKKFPVKELVQRADSNQASK